MKSQDIQMNTQNLSRKVSKISLDFSTEEASDNEFEFESAYARMLFAKDRKSGERNCIEDNKYDIKKIRKKRSIKKERESPNEILKQNIEESNSTLQTIRSMENAGRNYIYDKKNDFIEKSINYHKNLKYTEELQSMPQKELVDISAFSNSMALITAQTKINQHSQESHTFQTPALKQSWGINASSSARWKRIGRIGLGPPKRAERLSSESVDELENGTEVRQEDSKLPFLGAEKQDIQTFNGGKENIPHEHIMNKENQFDIFPVLSNSTSPIENQKTSPKKFKKMQSLLINPVNCLQDTDLIVQNKNESVLPVYISKSSLFENLQKNIETNSPKDSSIKKSDSCCLQSMLKSEKKNSVDVNDNVLPQTNSPNTKTNLSSLQNVSSKSKSITYVNSKPYNRLDLIGRGGSSKVFRVMDQNHKMFALKKVHFDKADKSAIVNFKDEIELLKKLSGHERIIKLYDSEINDTKGYLTMILEIGEIDLSHLLAKQHQRPLDINFVRLYWDQMLQAVQAVHDQKIVHSDLKPANFLLVEGSLKLIDFGIAKAIGNDTTNIHRDSQIGTINYMSPEALSEAHSSTPGEQKVMKLGRASDIWSLGCILYQMVYGKTPFAHLTMFQKIKAIPDPKHSINFPTMAFPIAHNGQSQPDGVRVNKNLIKVMKSCLERDQTKRKTIPELLQDRFLQPEKHLQNEKPTVRLTLEQMIQLVEQIVEAVKSEKHTLEQLKAATNESFARLLEIQEG
ncbi:hypothetical protein PNEG_00083 [Pneumocystis murina B123]|uniref:Protein kinase domain-containing protein n=1 Tax=Pneumocystis murina (strain B123) TaxID=1069680 RepID=M7PME4_PNEMU|nr:hypothetical protein PNEG_00083 [Pneumocystis murina B123]EMR11644.1 hypothetical protein PNEG_00083 [Pneumocystis murina B123]